MLGGEGRGEDAVRVMEVLVRAACEVESRQEKQRKVKRKCLLVGFRIQLQGRGMDGWFRVWE